MENIVNIAKVLSDINRINILKIFIKHNEVCVCEICDTLSLSQPLVSRHLKQMKTANIITSRQEGKWMLYTLQIFDKKDIMTCCINEIKKSISSLPKLIKCKR